MRRLLPFLAVALVALTACGSSDDARPDGVPDGVVTTVPSGPSSSDVVPSMRAWCEWAAGVQGDFDAWVEQARAGQLDTSDVRADIRDLRDAEPNFMEDTPDEVGPEDQGLIQTVSRFTNFMLQIHSSMINVENTLDTDSQTDDLEVAAAAANAAVEGCEQLGAR